MKSAAPVPERILVNGNFHTQDASCPQVTAVAMAAGRITAIGSDAEVKALAGAATESVDLGGRLGLPGIMDSHFHFYDWAMGRQQLALEAVASFREFLERVRGAARQLPPESWLLGQGWNEAEWPENRIPTRDDLDAAAPSHPVALWRCDLHLAVVNSRALELAGIDHRTPDPPEGLIDRDAAGRPTGVLRERAASLIKEVIPQPTEETTTEAMRRGIEALHRLGITGLHDVRLMAEKAIGARTLRAWQRLREVDALDLRCWSSLPAEALDDAIALGLRTGFGDERLRIGHVKFFADGGMGARTAWLLEPYLDAGCGMPLYPLEQLAEAVRKADAAGLAVMIHAIGDRANREIISIFEELQHTRASGAGLLSAHPSVPHRMEHVQMARREDLQRLGRLNVAASVQPNNLVIDINMIEESLGPRGRWAYPFRDILDAGVRMLLSSDCPVCNPSPWLGIHAAVTRCRLDGTPAGGWHPEQRISVAEAVRAFTLEPALAYGLGDQLGSITPGKRADLVVLDRDLYTVDPMEIPQTRVDLTLFDGRIVYRRGTV